MKPTLAFAAAVSSTLVVGASTVPAQAATQTTVSIHVQNAKKKPLTDVALLAFKGDTFVVVGVTNKKGNITKSAGVSGKLSGGSWELYLADQSYSRERAKTSYAPASFTHKLARGKTTVLKTRTLAAGAHVKGSVTTPSGLTVKGADVRVLASTDPGDMLTMAQITPANGSFHFYGLRTGRFFVRAAAGKNVVRVPIKVAKAGATYDGSISDLKLTCTTSFTATPGPEGTVTLSGSAAASKWGVARPGGGTITFLKDGRAFAEAQSVSGGRFSTTVPTDRNTDHTYTAKYTSGDCVDWKATSTVKMAPSA